MNDKLKAKIVQLSENYDKNLEEVMALFTVLKDKVKTIFPHLGEDKLNHRTFNGLEDFYGSQKFNQSSEFSFIPLGISSEAKDTNKKMREAILENFAKPNKTLQMINDKKVKVLKISEDVIDGVNVLYTDVYKPVKSIKSFIIMDNGEHIVTEGELWSPGDEGIARDYRETIKYTEEGEEYENRKWSYPLSPNWKLVIVGIGFFDGTRQIKNKAGEIEKKKKTIASDGLVCKVDFYGNEANPTHPKFFPKQNPFFKPCKIKAIKKKWSNDLFLSVTAKIGKGVSIDIDMVTKVKFSEWVDKNEKERKGLITIINERVKRKAQKINKARENTDLAELPKAKAKELVDLYNLYKKFLDVDYIPFIDLADVDEYHISHRARKDKDGNIIKSPKYEKGVLVEGEDGPWDEINFDSFALSECTLKGVYEKDDKPPKMILSDYSLPDDKSLFVKFSNGLDTEIRSASVLVCLTTSRGNQAYDPEVNKFVLDPENAVAIPKVKGVGMLVDFRKINISQLLGDL